MYKVRITDNEHFAGWATNRYRFFRFRITAILYTMIMKFFYETELEGRDES